MRSSAPSLNAAQAATRLGVSVKALRLYEQRGLIAPERTVAGWRVYGPDEMKRAGEIIALRALGFSLAQIERVLKGDPDGLEQALAAHQSVLEDRLSTITSMVATIATLRERLARGETPSTGDLMRLAAPNIDPRIAFALPWPWGGERFELGQIRALNYIIGPLGSGKTRLAQRLAETLPDAAFLGLDRLADGGLAARTRMNADPALKARVDQTLSWLVEDGAVVSDALVALLAGLETEGPAMLVVDMIEQGLCQSTQEALIAHLRRCGADARPLFVLTRSSSILDLAAVRTDEAIILCPANHSPPAPVAPYPGTPDYEAVATCLASPEIRARTEGVIAWRPPSGRTVTSVQ